MGYMVSLRPFWLRDEERREEARGETERRGGRKEGGRQRDSYSKGNV